MATTEVILTENIPGLGAEADIVNVKSGYARNYLVPQGLAYYLTPGALRTLNTLKAKRAEREARELNEAEALSKKIEKLTLDLVLETGETGKSFGSITSQDIAQKLKETLAGTEIDRHKIVLDHPIKTTGPKEVEIRLHPDVVANLALSISAAGAPEEEEAETEEKPKRRSKAQAD